MIRHVLKNTKRVFGISDFKYYALNYGLDNIFSQYPEKLLNSLKYLIPSLA
jgi:hypothetical protein